MKMRDLKEFIRGERVTEVVIVYEGVEHDIQSMDLIAAGEKTQRLILICDRLDAIDGSETYSGDFA